MDARDLARLLAQAALRAGVVGGVPLAAAVAAGVGTGLVGLALVLVGGLVAGISLVNPPTTDAGSVADMDPLLSTVAPMARWEAAGSPPVRRFLFGLVLLLIGVVAVVVAG